MINVRLESVDEFEGVGPPGVEVPERSGEDCLVECDREEEKSVMCVRV